MKNNSNLTKYLYLFLISSIINISSAKQIEFDLLSNITNSSLKPLQIISKDNICQTYIPSLFNPIPLIKSGDYNDINPQYYRISVSNPIINETIYDIYITYLTDSKLTTIFGMRIDDREDFCYFGLSSGKPSSIELKDYNNTFDFLKITNQIEEKIFSMDKWDINSNQIKSKLYLGYTHKDFYPENKKYIGTCQNIKEDSFWGCYFKQMIFNNTIISLNKSDTEFYKIYFSSEDYTIKFPNEFQDIFYNISNGLCNYNSLLQKTFCKDLFMKNFYIPLTLSNDNMDITLEIDSSKRFNSDDDQDSINMIFDEDIDYIIFPLIMFKNFHIQFDNEKNIIRFYSTNNNILHIKTKESKESEDNSSVLTIIIIILIIIIIIIALGLGIFCFIRKKRNDDMEKDVNKAFKDEE